MVSFQIGDRFEIRNEWIFPKKEIFTVKEVTETRVYCDSSRFPENLQCWPREAIQYHAGRNEIHFLASEEAERTEMIRAMVEAVDVTPINEYIKFEVTELGKEAA